MTSQKLVINTETGKSEYVDLSQDELEQQARDRAQSIERDATVEKEQGNRQTLLDRLSRDAINTEGRAVHTLNSNDQHALLALLLWKAGALNNDGTIKTLTEWI